MWQPDDQGYAVAFVVFSSVGGSVLGPIVGPILADYAQWVRFFPPFVASCVHAPETDGGLLLRCSAGVSGSSSSSVELFRLPSKRSCSTCLMHPQGSSSSPLFFLVSNSFFLVPETRSTILLDREARRRRKNGQTNVWGPEEIKEKRIDFKELMHIWARPFIMLVTEPIVLFLSLLSGFSDALSVVGAFFQAQPYHPPLTHLRNRSSTASLPSSSLSLWFTANG